MAPKQNAAAAVLPADPVWDAILRAPIDHSPLPEQVLRDIEESEATSRFLDGEAVSAEIAARAR
jgi:hypothetical protein